MDNQQGRIKVFGQGGQGVQFLADVLVKYLGFLDYNATFLPEYDAAVRGGKITAEVAFDQEKTPCPQGTEFEAVFYLNKNEKNKNNIKAKQTFDIQELMRSEKKYTNMYVLGRIMQILNLPLKKEPLLKALPDKRKQDNYQLVLKGYKDNES